MEVARLAPRCARCNTQQAPGRIYASSNSSPLRPCRLTPRAAPKNSRKQFSTSQACRDTKQPPRPTSTPGKPQPPRQSIQDLLRDLRRGESSSAPTESASSRMDALMGFSTPNHKPTAGASRTASFAEIMGSSATSSRRGGGFDQNRMLKELNHELHDTPDVSLRLRPTLGRTVDGLYGDPSKGFRMLERKCQENKIRATARSQLFHVRRGMQRKILKMERWRKLFKEGFVAECTRIRRMRKQGW